MNRLVWIFLRSPFNLWLEPKAREEKRLALNWVRTGTDHASTVVFLHAVGYDLTYWGGQIAALNGDYNLVAFDLPGHGRSTGDAADWSFDRVASVVAKLIEEVSDGPVHLVGLSFGGMIAQATVLARPDLIRSLTLMGTASQFSEEARAGMKARAEATRQSGMAAVLPSSLDRWFTPETRARRPDLIDRVTKTILGDDPAVHAAIWDMISEFDVHDRLGEVRCPTLVLVGERDPSTPPSAASVLAEGIPGARMVVLPNASHMIQLEAPEAVNAELKGFLDQQPI